MVYPGGGNRGDKCAGEDICKKKLTARVFFCALGGYVSTLPWRPGPFSTLSINSLPFSESPRPPPSARVTPAGRLSSERAEERATPLLRGLPSPHGWRWLEVGGSPRTPATRRSLDWSGPSGHLMGVDRSAFPLPHRGGGPRATQSDLNNQTTKFPQNLPKKPCSEGFSNLAHQQQRSSHTY